MFERLIRSTKRCLKKAIGRRRLTYEELETVLIDVEAVLNSRPLTYLYANDTDTPITPSHLFCGRRLLDQHEDTGKDDVSIPKMNRKKVVATATKEGEAVAHFWKRWHREYLIDLRETHKLSKTKKGPTVSVGDVVLVEEANTKRNEWKLGRVEKTIKGKDGVIRGAEVKTRSGRIARPVQKLYPLEINGGGEEEEKIVNSVGNSNDPKTPSDLDSPSLHCPKTSHSPQISLDGDAIKTGSSGGRRSTTSATTTTTTSATTTTTTTSTGGGGRVRRTAAVAGEAARRTGGN